VNALYHAREAGRSQGYLEGQRQAERQSGDAYLRGELEHLRGVVTSFEEATGTKLDTYSAAHLARVAALAAVDPERMVDSLGYAGRGLQTARAALDEAITRLRGLPTTVDNLT
jgi:hypothetical protein